MKISIIIPVYKNKDLFRKSFMSNYKYIKDCEIIVVNDFPDEPIGDIFEKYPEVMLMTNEINLGFAKTVNRGVKKASGELIFLLNSDVFLKDYSYKSVIKQFEDNGKLFAVSFAQIESDKRIVGKNKIFFKHGLIMHSKADDLEFGETGWAEGGTCIIRKTFFESLNGFDSKYSPFYWEDVDLSLRARKKGWDVIFDPAILVEHHHASTIGKYYDSSFRDVMSYRNQFICTWKNTTVFEKMYHIIILPYLLIQSVLKGNTALLKGFLKAVVRMLEK